MTGNEVDVRNPTIPTFQLARSAGCTNSCFHKLHSTTDLVRAHLFILANTQNVGNSNVACKLFTKIF